MNADLVTLVEDVTTKNATDHSPGALPACWPTLVDLGLTQIGVPEEHGGVGGSLDDLVTVVRSLAARGTDAPVAEAATAAWALGSCVTSPTSIAVATLADHEPRTGDEIAGIPWITVADRLIVFSLDGVAWSITDPRVTSSDAPLHTHGAVDLRASTVVRTEAAHSRSEVENRIALLVTARLAGAIEGAYRMTKAYVKEREQFGKPLLSIPAVATNLARMKTLLVETEAALERATAHLTVAGDDWGAVASSRVVSGRAATEAARIAHQLHGAMGTTAEYGLGAYSRMLWGYRDSSTPPSTWAAKLGRIAGEEGEAHIWAATRSVVRIT